MAFMIHKTKHCILFYIFILLCCFSATAFSQVPREKIRVGVSPISAFYYIDAQGNLSGYGYDYLQEIARYSGWQYEYVPAPWWQSLEMLKTGEIDLLGFASSDEARRRSFCYASQPSNLALAALYVKSDNKSVIYEEDPTFQQLHVGLVKEKSYNQIFDDFCVKHRLTLKKTTYDSVAELLEAFRIGEIDAIVMLDLGKNAPQMKKVASLGQQPLYFITAQNQTGHALIQVFNEAQSQLQNDMPYFEALLHEKYFHNEALAFTAEEKEYIKSRANRAVAVVYEPDWAPIEYYNTSTNTIEGITADLFKYITEYSGLTFTFTHGQTFSHALKFLESNEAEVVAAVSATAENYLRLTDTYLSVPSIMIQNNTLKQRESTILILPESYTTVQKYLGAIDPNMTIVYGATVRECFDAVADGTADITYTNIYVANTLLQNYKYRNLTSTFVPNYEDQMRLGVSEHADPRLLSILNKTLHALSKERMDAIVLQNTSKQVPKDELMTYLFRHLNEVLLIAACLILLLLSIFSYILLMKNRYNRTIEKLAFIDDLTGMWNYNKFKKEAAALLTRFPKNKYAVLYIDISKFKYINSSFGFEVGDHVLKHVASVLAKNIPAGNIFSRSAADQFILMLHYSEKLEIITTLRRLYQQMQNFPRTTTASYTLSFSCGIALIELAEKNSVSVSINTAIDQAIMAQRTVKGVHGNSYAFYNDAFREQIIKEKSIEDIMEKALENREFIVYYQPKYNLSNNQISGAEALVRWKNPQHGMIYPNDFIPLFEKNGFITSLDFYVLRVVCQTLKELYERGRALFPISVNISRVHVGNPHFTHQLCDVIDQYEIPHNLIELEITENAFVENAENLQKLIRQLKQLDFIVSMDDFGSGFSSLNLLKEIPFDVLKIDKDFFQKGYSTEREQIIIASIVEMSQKLNIKVVAEGVETNEQAEFLRNIHCDMAQGYLFSKPVELSEFMKKF